MSVASKRRAGRPTRDDTRRKSETLLDAATTLFVERGFEGTTMEAIAAAANMGKQAVYMRYPDKEAVFTAVIQRLEMMVEAVPMPIEDTLPLKEGLPVRLRSIITAAAGPIQRLIAQLTFREGYRFPALVRFLSNATAERFIRPLAAYFDKAKAAGEVGPVDSFAAASLCIDLVSADLVRAVFAQVTLTPEDIERRAHAIAGFALYGLLKRERD